MVTAKPASRTQENLRTLLEKSRPSTDDFRRMFRLVNLLKTNSSELVGNYLQQIRQLAVQNHHQRAECVALQMLADLCLDRGDFSGCLEFARQELAAAQACQEERYVASYHFLTGRAQEMTGQFDLARASYEEAVAIYRRIGRRSAEHHVLNQLANLLTLRGEATAALGYYQRCLETADLPYQKAIYLHNIGEVLRQLGKWEEAFEHFYRSLALTETLERTAECVRTWAHLNDSLAQLYLCRDRPEKAINTLNRILEAATRSPLLQTDILADALAHLSDAYLRQGNLASAEKALSDGLELADRIGDRRARPGLLWRLAEVCLQKGETTEGHAQVSAALQLAQEMELRHELCEAWRVQGRLYAATGFNAQAKASFQQAIAALSGLEDSYELARARLEYGQFLIRSGEPAAAESELRKAARVFSRLQVVAESQATHRLLLSPELTAERELSLLLAISEIALLRLGPERFVSRVLDLLCTALGFEAAAIVIGDKPLVTHGNVDIDAARRAASSQLTGTPSLCWQAGTTSAFIYLERRNLPGTEPTRATLDAVGNLLSPAITEIHERVEEIGSPQLPSPSLPKSLVFRGIAGSNPGFLTLLETVARIANTNVSVLIRGESGTGKELVARAVHDSGPRASRRFVAINCAAVPETLLEAELFGVEKGAATGVVQRPGRLEQADRGTVFLDEIGDMSLTLQAKLLRFLQERTFERVGGERTVSVDVRIIAATNRDINSMVKNGQFRQDLYYRLNTVELTLPPLRDRTRDIPALVQHFIEASNHEFGRSVSDVDLAAMRMLCRYSWPGNIRELQHVIERAVAVCDGNTITAADLPSAVTGAAAPARRQQRLHALSDSESTRERQELSNYLKQAGGDAATAAAAAGYSRAHFYRLLKKHNIPPSRKHNG